MHEKAIAVARIDINWIQILKYASFITPVAVLPVAFTTCTISVKAILRRRRKRRRDKITRKYALRRNYELSKRVSKKVRKSDP